MQIDPSIFKAYDIRGIYQENLDEDLAERIGKAFAQLIKSESGKPNPTVVVGRDMRLSGPTLKAAVISGITSMGVSVIDINLASTPTFYYAVGRLGADGGIQVSASHNPAEWNGFKMVRAMAKPISGDTGISIIRDAALNNIFEESQTPGTVSQNDQILQDLVETQTKNFDLSKIKPFKIVADVANAMGALDLEALFEKLPCELAKLNFELDGSFPAHEADPLKAENMTQLQEAVKTQGADLGISTDGDGDRIFFVDEKGQTVPPEIIRGILAQMVLRNNPGAKIGYDIRPGKITQDMIEEAGGQPFVTRVGHSLIKELMIQENSPFSGESSGHFFFKSEFGSYESTVKSVVLVLTWLSEQNMSFSQAVEPLKRYYHSGEINSVVSDMQAVFDELKAKYSDAKNMSELDGILIEYDDFWFNVRGSNTEPKMRLNLEAIDPETMAAKRDEVLAIIRKDS